MNYNPHFLDQAGVGERLLPIAFSVFPGGNKTLPYYKKTAIWGVGRKMKRLLSGHRQDEAGRSYITWREHRRNAVAIRNTLPDLSSALEEFSRNINTIIDLAKNRSIHLIS